MHNEILPTGYKKYIVILFIVNFGILPTIYLIGQVILASALPVSLQRTVLQHFHELRNYYSRRDYYY